MKLNSIQNSCEQKLFIIFLRTETRSNFFVNCSEIKKDKGFFAYLESLEKKTKIMNLHRYLLQIKVFWEFSKKIENREIIRRYWKNLNLLLSKGVEGAKNWKCEAFETRRKLR